MSPAPHTGTAYQQPARDPSTARLMARRSVLGLKAESLARVGSEIAYTPRFPPVGEHRQLATYVAVDGAESGAR